MAHAKETQLAHFAEYLARDEAVFFPGIGARNDAILDIAPQRLPDHLMFVVERVHRVEKGRGHFGSP